VLVQPLLLLLAKHVLQHHARLDGHARQPLEAEPALVRVRVLRVHVADDEDRFDPDAEFVGFV
jgi:hypothetical protein